MPPFVMTHAGEMAPDDAVAACVAALAHAEPAAGLGLVYVTDHMADALPHLLDRLRSETPIEDWIGSVGIGICATGREYFDAPAVALMVLDIPRTDYRVFDTIREDVGAFSRGNAAWIAAHGARFGVIHADPRNSRTPDIVADLADALDGFLVGGLSSARGTPSQVAGGVAEGGVSGALLSENVCVTTALSQSCMPIGDLHEITECEGNVLVTLDDAPALDVFKEDIGELLARDLRRVGGYIFAALPVIGSDTGDYMVRNLVGLDVDQKLVGIGETVERGMQVQFCRRDAAAAEEDLVRMIDSLKRRGGSAARGGLYFSCLARGPNMFGEQSKELRLIQRELGDIPLVGFFCNGEISHNRLYAYTGVLTLFS